MVNKPTNDTAAATARAARERRLAAAALLAPRVAGDYLLLDDAVLRAAIDGSGPLSAGELAALAASPLTLRRFRQLALSARAASRTVPGAGWHASVGLLRAADSGAALITVETDDRHWALHFLAQDGHWQVVLKLDAGAPFAARLLAGGAVLEVRDGAGAMILQGALDRDGECEQAWPFDEDPAPRLQRHGAGFAVSLASGHP
ncbi:hypothetical protein [Massilia sp. DWR3-1-1]|uniref:hypothetical protein n=1 Tax=Massilia sp. DWR3-1-1 TaxID=2804559 RepID=UPI003CFA5652